MIFLIFLLKIIHLRNKSKIYLRYIFKLEVYQNLIYVYLEDVLISGLIITLLYPED